MISLLTDSRPNDIPTGEDIERFLLSWPKSSKGKSREPIAYTYVNNGIKHLISGLIFRYHGFKLDKTDGSRLKSAMKLLVDQGLITKDPIREKLWITSKLVSRIVNALVSDALDYGTRRRLLFYSWDHDC